MGVTAIILKLFTVFAKIGAFSFGGGYAMLPFIYKELVIKNAWITLKQYSDIIAISQMTPGAVAISYASFIGYKFGGIIGCIAASLGVILPSFLMIVLIASVFKHVYEKNIVKAIFMGIRPGTLGLLAAAAYTITVSNVADIKGILIFVASLGILFRTKIDPIVILLGAGFVGILLY
jgi:chromate transporter